MKTRKLYNNLLNYFNKLQITFYILKSTFIKNILYTKNNKKINKNSKILSIRNPNIMYNPKISNTAK